MKKCKQCLEIKEIGLFDIRKDFSDGYSSICKICRRKNQNIYYKLHPRKYTTKIIRPRGYYYKYVKARRERIKAKYGFGGGFLSRYGLKILIPIYQKYNSQCNICKTTENLTIHHLDGKGRGYWEKTGNKMNNELSNLELICRKCHGRIEGRKSQRMKKLNYKTDPAAPTPKEQ